MESHVAPALGRGAVGTASGRARHLVAGVHADRAAEPDVVPLVDPAVAGIVDAVAALGLARVDEGIGVVAVAFADAPAVPIEIHALVRGRSPGVFRRRRGRAKHSSKRNESWCRAP